MKTAPATTAVKAPAQPKKTLSSEEPILKEHSFARPDVHPYDEIEWEVRTASIKDETGKSIFEQDNIEVPKAFSELATKILASKYFYGDAERGFDPTSGGRESSFRQVIDRVAKTLSKWGLEDGYFQTETEAKVFEEGVTPTAPIEAELAAGQPDRRVQFTGMVQPRAV